MDHNQTQALKLQNTTQRANVLKYWEAKRNLLPKNRTEACRGRKRMMLMQGCDTLECKYREFLCYGGSCFATRLQNTTQH
jgi:hypothetical protein